jgi:hypothetical protein
LPSGPAPDATLAATKIKHLVVVMQENRSFDSYFGTYPRCGRHPRVRWGTDDVCTGPGRGCQRPFHDGVARTDGGANIYLEAAAGVTLFIESGPRRPPTRPGNRPTQRQRTPRPPPQKPMRTV